MKTFKLKNSLFVLAMSVCFIACRKNHIKSWPLPPEEPFPKENSAIDQPTIQVFTFSTSDLPYTIYTENGTSIYIPEKAFTVAGDLAEGEVKMSVQEFLKKGEMVAAGIHTMSSNKLLESYGSLHIDATIDDKPVDRGLFNGSSLLIKKRAEGAIATMVFKGNMITTPESLVPQFSWQIAIDKVLENNGQFKFNWGTLGWINCGIFYKGTEPKTTLFVKLPDNPGQIAGFDDHSNTYVFFVPKGMNSVVPINSHSNNEQVYSYPNGVPVGMQGMLIGYCVKDGHYWYAKKEVAIVDTQTEILMLSPSDPFTIQKEMAALNDY